MQNSRYFGDCLHVLRDLATQHPGGFVDLFFLDPPFNSKRDYSILFKSPKGHESHAQIKPFVTLSEPTKLMQVEALKSGYYESPHHGKFPKIQILTIRGLLDGTQRPLYPDMSGGVTFKKAKLEQRGADQEEMEI